jgi:hypothetical protein
LAKDLNPNLERLSDAGNIQIAVEMEPNESD